MDMSASHGKRTAHGRLWRGYRDARTRTNVHGTPRKRSEGRWRRIEGGERTHPTGAKLPMAWRTKCGNEVHGVSRRDPREWKTRRWTKDASWDEEIEAIAVEHVPATAQGKEGVHGEQTDGEVDAKTRRRRKKTRTSPKTARKRRRRHLLRDARAIVEERLLALLDERGGEASLRVLLEEYRLVYGSALRFADDYGVEDARELLRTLPRTYPMGQPGNAAVARAPATDSLRERLVILMRKHRCIRVSEFNQMYARLYGEPLRLKEHGLERVVDLAEAYPDIVTLEQLVHEEGRKKGRAYKVLRIQPQASERRRRKNRRDGKGYRDRTDASTNGPRFTKHQKESLQAH